MEEAKNADTWRKARGGNKTYFSLLMQSILKKNEHQGGVWLYKQAWKCLSGHSEPALLSA